MEEQTPRYDGTWNDLVGKYAYLKTNKYIEKGYRLGFKLIQVPLSYNLFLLNVVYSICIMSLSIYGVILLDSC